MRQIVLDTETTGLEVELGHRIIEIGCVELTNRRTSNNNWHRYHNPGRAIDPGAEAVHGLSATFLADKPPFSEAAAELWKYLAGAELIIHNAPFDLGFLNREFELVGMTQRLEEVCKITDTVKLARKLHPGQKVNLDALCKRYSVDNSNRGFHGALLDAQLLAEVYLAMTGGQSRLGLEEGDAGGVRRHARFVDLLAPPDVPLPVLKAADAELAAHRARLQAIAAKGQCLWRSDLPE